MLASKTNYHISACKFTAKFFELLMQNFADIREAIVSSKAVAGENERKWGIRRTPPERE